MAKTPLNSFVRCREFFPWRSIFSQFYNLECFLLNFDHFLATKTHIFYEKSLQIDCKTQFQYFNADPACFGTELPGSKTRPIESFLFLRRMLESRTRGRGGSDVQCPQRSGRSILKIYAWFFCKFVQVLRCLHALADSVHLPMYHFPI